MQAQPVGCGLGATLEPADVLAHVAFLLAADMPDEGCGDPPRAATPEVCIPIPCGAVFAEVLPDFAQPFEARVRLGADRESARWPVARRIPS